MALTTAASKGVVVNITRTLATPISRNRFQVKSSVARDTPRA
jgi:hypothetical protein